MKTSKLSGVNMIKKLYESLSKINQGFDKFDFQTKMEFLI